VRGGDWMHVSQDKDQWRTLVNMVMTYIKDREFLD
jgi:hypothetical protein